MVESKTCLEDEGGLIPSFVCARWMDGNQFSRLRNQERLTDAWVSDVTLVHPGFGHSVTQCLGESASRVESVCPSALEDSGIHGKRLNKLFLNLHLFSVGVCMYVCMCICMYTCVFTSTCSNVKVRG